MFDFQGTDNQRRIATEGLARCDFRWPLLATGLAGVGRTAIPVEWADLSRWGTEPASSSPYEASVEGAGHDHVHEGGDTAHPLEVRQRVLGLAWYSGRISLDLGLEADPALAAEVLLAEGAHMVDFFYMSPAQREGLYDIAHHGDTTEHDHGWFEETGNTDYWSWVGEAWMALFCLAYSDVVPTLTGFVHQADVAMVPAVRELLRGPYFATNGSRVFHDRHKGRRVDVEWATYAEAVASGRRACGVCRPKPPA